jgi:hypothetical protein
VKAMRFLIATCSIFTGAVIGHDLGNGSFAVGNFHFLFLLLIAFASLYLSRNSLEGPKLAMVIALAQFGTHFFFSTNGNAELAMTLSHLVLGICTYQLIVHMDAFFDLIFKLIEKFTVVVFTVVRPICFRSLVLSADSKVYISSRNLICNY